MVTQSTPIRTILRGAVFLAFLALIAGFSATAVAGSYEDELKAKGAKALNTSEIKALFSGNTYKGTSSRGSDFSMLTRSDGSVVINITTSSGKEKEDTGEWAAEDNKFCRQYTRFGGGKRACRPIYRTVPDSIPIESVTEDGDYSSRGKIYKGNIDSL